MNIFEANKTNMKQNFINISKIVEQFGNLEDVKEVLDFFLTEIPESLENLKMALKNENWEKLYQYAHFLKGSCQSMAVEKCAVFLESLGNEAKKNQNITKMQTLIEQIIFELDNASQEIQHFLAKNK
ncbi:MAG: Hpt domain-containing protein [Bacteroidetes bacterium]|nr:MAG: Hpt domain-containing protein [Bacteroidota bacterium]